MKHITFDESSVLNEFIKIAHEKGLIKQASSPVADLLQAAKQSVEMGPNKVLWDRFVGELEQVPGNVDAAKLKGYLASRWKYPKIQNLINTHLSAPETPSPVKALKQMALQGSSQGGTGAVPYRMLLNELKGFKDETPADLLMMEMSKRYPQLKSDVEKSLAAFLSAPKKSNKREDNVKKANENPQKVSMDKLNQYSANLMKSQLAPEQRRAKFEKALMDQLNWLSKKYAPHVQAGRATKEQVDGALKAFDAQAKKFQAYTGSPVPVNASVKSAAKDEGQKYDVTGETGEQLVEKAHPGGGTKTELTHSKTDENLVETIVEQQKRDIDVVNKMPKGTYAALVGLADRLDKLGLYTEASEVDNMLVDMIKSANKSV